MNTRLREVRKSLKLTQQEFGSKIGLSKASIGNIENGIINLTDRNISLICSTYNVNENWLRNGKGEMLNPMSEDEEFSYMIGALMAEDCEYKKNFIKSMLELDDELDWMIVTNLVEGLKKKNEKKVEK
ncbi:helix-turn-helix domain-containing protein [Clostridium sp.]